MVAPMNRRWIVQFYRKEAHAFLFSDRDEDFLAEMHFIKTKADCVSRLAALGYKVTKESKTEWGWEFFVCQDTVKR